MFLKANWSWESEFKSDRSFASLLQYRSCIAVGFSVGSNHDLTSVQSAQRE